MEKSNNGDALLIKILAISSDVENHLNILVQTKKELKPSLGIERRALNINHFCSNGSPRTLRVYGSIWSLYI